MWSPSCRWWPHGHEGSKALPIWNRQDFCGPLLVRSHVYAERACLCQSVLRVQRARSRALWDRENARMPSHVAVLGVSAVPPRCDSKAALWSALTCQPGIGWVGLPCSHKC